MADQAEKDELPEPGPPFRVGERVAFAPLVIGPTRRWLEFGEAVIVAVSPKSESCRFRGASEPGGAIYGQGMENIVRITPNYRAWLDAWEVVYARTGDEAQADRETNALLLRMVAEHPIHGRALDAARRRRQM